MKFNSFLAGLVIAAAALGSRSMAAQPGSLDLSFDPGSGADDLVKQVVVLDNGKILVAGYFTSINGVARRGIAQLESSGAVDPSFDPGLGVDNGISAVAVQKDGKILIGGDFTQVGGTDRGRIARLNSNGKLDTTFDPGTGATGTGTVIIFTLAIQTDGKILAGGSFTNFNEAAQYHLVRLDSTGKLDPGFNAKFEEPTGKGIFKVKPQSNGQILVGGVFTRLNGMTRSAVARLNSNGSLDTSFDAKFDEFSVVFTFDFQGDQRLIVGGVFATIADTLTLSIAGLKSDGSIDAAFRAETLPDDQVNSLNVLSDGKVLAGGYFKTIDRISRNGIARLKSDGALDLEFNPGLGVTGGTKNGLLSVFPQLDGKVMIGGDFTMVNGTARRGIARLFGTSEVVNPVTIASQPVGQTVCPGAVITLSVSATGTGPLSYQWRKTGNPIQGAISSSYTMASAAAADAGSYDVVVTGASGAVLSNPATIEVNVPVTITSQPQNWSVDVGGSVTFSVEANGTGPLSYQWSKDGGLIPGATGLSYTIASVAATDDANYGVLVTGACGSAVSANGRLFVTTPGAFSLQSVERAAAGGIQLHLAGEIGRSYSIQTSTNLIQWNVWTNLVAQGTNQPLVDNRFTNVPYLFYKATTP